MPRQARPRPAGEHVMVVLRVLRQVDADDNLKPVRKRKIKKALGAALTELQKELGE